MSGLQRIISWDSQNLSLRLRQSCGKEIKGMSIDKRLIRLDMKNLCTNEDLIRTIVKLKSFKWLDSVQAISLPNSCITGKGILLFESFRNLTEVDLSGSFAIKGNEFNNLSCIKKLERLNLYNNKQIGKEGMEAVEFMRNLPNLKHIDLMLTGVGIGSKWEHEDRWDDFMKELHMINPELDILYDKDPFGF